MKTVWREAWELSSILEIDRLASPPKASPTAIAEMITCEGKTLLRRSVEGKSDKKAKVSAVAVAGERQHRELDRCTRIVESIRRGVR